MPGVPKCGPKTAVKWLAEHGSLDGVIAAAEQIKTGRGIRTSGASRSGALMDLGGKYLFRMHEGSPDYPSVYYIFNRIREAMPAFGADLIGVDTKADIVAYMNKIKDWPGVYGTVTWTPEQHNGFPDSEVVMCEVNSLKDGAFNIAPGYSS